MATRATYTFKTETQYKFEGPADVHVYIHYDGYPSGAASYFNNALKLLNERRVPLSNIRGGITEQFIRANNLAEITSHADNHGDTEFHYDITKGDTGPIRIEAYELRRDETKYQFFNGTLEGFVARYLVPETVAE